MIDLARVRDALLKKHKQYEDGFPDDDYREGVLGGLAVALHTIDNLMENDEEQFFQKY